MKIARTGNEQQFLGFGLLHRASPVLLVSAAAQRLKRLVDHSLQLPCFFIKSLGTQTETQCKLQTAQRWNGAAYINYLFE